MSEVVNGSLNDVLGAIKNVQDKNVYPVFIPSLQKTVMFKEMNTGQEKMIVKTIVDSPFITVNSFLLSEVSLKPTVLKIWTSMLLQLLIRLRYVLR